MTAGENEEIKLFGRVLLSPAAEGVREGTQYRKDEL